MKSTASLISLLVAFSAFSCGDDTVETEPELEGTRFIFDLDADLTDPAKFFDAPYPSDARLTAEGTPDLRGFANPLDIDLVRGLVANASEAHGFPVIPVAYFRFDGPIAEQAGDVVLPLDATAPVLFVDVDPDSPDVGTLIPALAKTLEEDRYTTSNVLAVLPRPGFILRPNTKYGVVVMKNAGDAQGLPLATNQLVQRLALRKPDKGEEALDTQYEPLWDALASLSVPTGDVVAATVFTTGDVVAEMSALGDAVLEEYDVEIEGLALDAAEEYPELCTLRGTVTLPQFQAGDPPFDTLGRLVFEDGKVELQREDVVPVALVIPKQTMPEDGYPLILNIHGSGGFSIAMVRPVDSATGMPGDPIGPAFPHALKNIATAGLAMPVNPERLPGASEIEYLNTNNFGAMRDTFRQGTLDARLYLEALTKLEIPPDALAACTGAALPAGATAFKFDASKVIIMGQSMGGMYTNIIGATEPVLRAAVPTGAGGHWTFFILETTLNNGLYPGLVKAVLGSSELTLFHPALSVGAAGLEAADPMVYMPRVARRPLDGHPVRPTYEPVAQFDSYFPTVIYDAAALAYGHEQAGESVWPEMQDALALAGRDGIIEFPVVDNLESEAGGAYTGVVAQFEGDGTYDPHAIYVERDDVKRQYSCFVDSFMKTGVGTVPALSEDWEAPCP